MYKRSTQKQDEENNFQYVISYTKYSYICCIRMQQNIDFQHPLSNNLYMLQTEL